MPLILEKDKVIKAHHFSAICEAVNIIVNIYHENEVCLGDIFAAIEIEGASIEEVIEIAARARYEIDDWHMIMTTDTDPNHVIDLYDGKETDDFIVTRP